MKPNGTSRLTMRSASKALPLTAIAKVAAPPAKSHLSIWVRLEQCERE